jgi:hypothetical protein
MPSNSRAVGITDVMEVPVTNYQRGLAIEPRHLRPEFTP